MVNKWSLGGQQLMSGCSLSDQWVVIKWPGSGEYKSVSRWFSSGQMVVVGTQMSNRLANGIFPVDFRFSF